MRDAHVGSDAVDAAKTGTDDLFPVFDRPRIPRLVVVLWNLGVLLWGVGFFYQEAAWATVPFALGAAVVTALWLSALAAAAAGHLGALRSGEATGS